MSDSPNGPDGAADHRPIAVGRIEVVPVCEGFAPLALADELPGAGVDWTAERARYPWAFVASAWPWHVHAFAVRTPGGVVLIDSGLGAFPPYRPWTEHTDRADALDRAGVRSEDVRDVVLTHLHADHAGGVASADGTPRFPNARVHVHAADRERFEAAPGEDGYDAGHEIAALDRNGVVETTAEDHEVTPGLRVLHSPGHTPGHRSVLVEDGDVRLLLTGDLLHLPTQIELADRASSHDDDPELAARSRTALLERARDDRWLVGVSHFARPFGTLDPVKGGWRSAMP